MKLIFATRPSALARWQTRWVIDALQHLHPGLACEEKIIATQGDRVVDKPLPEIGGKGLFTQELESELLSGAVQCAVHSLKDLPVEGAEGLIVGCIPVRAEVSDALVAAGAMSLDSLPRGAVVGTSSLRRSAQLLAARPDIQTKSLRGNVDTRMRKAMEGQYDAIILAGAGLIRLGLEENVRQWLPLDIMLPAPGQGALAVECRADDKDTLGLLEALEDGATRRAVTAERAFLAGLGGGCAVPVAAYATGDSEIHLRGLVASADGKQIVRVSGEGQDANAVGQRAAQQALAHGAGEILKLGEAQ
jgi:hydroxymethylbilane synthase